MLSKPHISPQNSRKRERSNSPPRRQTSPASACSSSESTASDYVDDPRLQLTAQERGRAPIPVQANREDIEIPAKALREEFTCPVCRNILHNTHVTIECMHRFCHGCIKEALFKGNKQCPTCRCRCDSMRNLRPDSRFDDLIRLFRAGLQDAQRSEEEAIARSTQALQRRYEEGMRRQWKHRQAVMRRNRPDHPTARHATAAATASAAAAAAAEPTNATWRTTIYHSKANDDEDDDDEEIIVSSPPPPPSRPPPPPLQRVAMPRAVTHEKPRVARMPAGCAPQPWSVEVTLIAHPTDKRLPIGEVVSLRTTDQCTVAHMALVLRQYYADLSPPHFATLSDADFVFALTRAPEDEKSSSDIFVLASGATVGDALRLEAGGDGSGGDVLVLFHTLA
ncbi:hypothetical protein HDU89_005648 [Geranomyces variabilis]|nr:hypothetical protein HDU89_005648 [Geranomyces variabilis]